MSEDNEKGGLVSVAHDFFGLAGASKWGRSITDALFMGIGRIYRDVGAGPLAKGRANAAVIEGKAAVDLEVYRLEQLTAAHERLKDLSFRAEVERRDEDLRKQANIERVALYALEQVPTAEPASEPVDSDWMNDFRELARRTSREDMQRLLAKILISEMADPGSYPFSVALKLRGLSTRALSAFAKYSRLNMLGFGIVRTFDPDRDPKYGINFEDHLSCAHEGLINQSETLYMRGEGEEEFNFRFRGEIYSVSPKDKTANTPVYAVTEMGDRISSLLDNEMPEDYFIDATKLLSDTGWLVTRRP